jgi:hypothetical protein
MAISRRYLLKSLGIGVVAAAVMNLVDGPFPLIRTVDEMVGSY